MDILNEQLIPNQKLIYNINHMLLLIYLKGTQIVCICLP